MTRACFKDEAVYTMRSIVALVLIVLAAGSSGCAKPQYGVEDPTFLPGGRRQTWAVAPAINLSGQQQVDAILQADLLYQQLQQVKGLTVIPVNRVAEVYASLRIHQVQSEEQAALVCDLLGCDGIVVPTITAFDPYDPPKVGASLQLFHRPSAYARPEQVDPRNLARSASPPKTESVPRTAQFVQVVGMFDAANGSVRSALATYVKGRHDPLGPLGDREYLVNMDRYCGFVYHSLVADLLSSPRLRR